MKADFPGAQLWVFLLLFSLFVFGKCRDVIRFGLDFLFKGGRDAFRAKKKEFDPIYLDFPYVSGSDFPAWEALAPSVFDLPDHAKSAFPFPLQ